MLSSAEINQVKFSKAMSGYNREEVEILLDKVEADYIQFERIIKECKEEIKNYQNELKELKESHDNIQNVLLSAQGLADRIVGEAKEKSDEIIRNAEKNIAVISERERELSAAFELNAQQRKVSLEKELSDMVTEAQLKADSIVAAANDSVARQQMLFDKIKFEIAAFKTSINNKYKEHFEILNQIPDSVPNDPKYLAELVSASFTTAPAPEEFVSKTPSVMSKTEEIVLEPQPEIESEITQEFSDGFKVLNVE